MHACPRRIQHFVCPAFVRAIRYNAKSSGSPRKPPLVQNIEKLESYIKELRKDVRKRASQSKIVNQEMHGVEEDIDKLYASLDAPAQGVLPAPKELMSPALCSKLAIDSSSNLKKLDWRKVVDDFLSTTSVEALHSREIEQVLAAMPHEARIVSGRRLLDASRWRATRLTYDLLMDSYATLGHASSALELFDAARQVGHKASLYSYAHLMKAFSVVKDLPKAMALYRHMQTEKIQTNLVIDTSLISTCIKTGRIDWAFATFDALKYKATEFAPDAQLYSLMIHACSLDPQLSAERASDLFMEMTERGLKPTKATFNALINVYAQREDYFLEAWKTSDTMQQNRIEMDKTTWHSLLSACVTSRDILRARKLVREMLRLGTGKDEWQPDAITFQLLFRAYARARVRKSLSPANILDASQSLRKVDEASLWVDEQPFSSNALLRESAQMRFFLETSHPQLLNLQVLDTYMTIAPTFGASEQFKHDWETVYTAHSKGRYSYQIALSACYAFKDWDFLQKIWQERQTWRAQVDVADSDITTPLKTPSDVHGDFEATRMYIECLARLNRIQQATEVLNEARDRFVFEKEHLKCFQTKSIQVGDEEAVLLYLDMFPEDHKQAQRRPRRSY